MQYVCGENHVIIGLIDVLALIGENRKLDQSCPIVNGTIIITSNRNLADVINLVKWNKTQKQTKYQLTITATNFLCPHHCQIC